MNCTLDSRYIAVEYNAILNTIRKEESSKFVQIWTHKDTPCLPLGASYGAFLAVLWRKDIAIYPECILFIAGIYHGNTHTPEQCALLACANGANTFNFQAARPSCEVVYCESNLDLGTSQGPWDVYTNLPGRTSYGIPFRITGPLWREYA